MISVAHLTRRFGDFTAVDDLTFEIAKGEVVGFLGPNGAGKTTTLRILAGYLPATGGSARVAGFDVLRQSMEVRRRIGYLPESVPLYREHRVIEMLEFQARLHRMPRQLARRRAAEVLELVGLTDRRRDLIGHLSRGLKQRAGLAVALLPDPEVLILDEPTSGLDPIQRIEVRRLIQGLAARHTVILSSHILSEIEATCPRVIILHQGRLAADGTRDSLVQQDSAAHVRVEAVVGPDAAAAATLLKSLRGVRDVIDRGRLGIHHQFDVVCDEDLREDVGALAAAKRWALRELSWRRPSLEQIFARIALGTAADDAARAAASPTERAGGAGGSTTTSAAQMGAANAGAATTGAVNIGAASSGAASAASRGALGTTLSISGTPTPTGATGSSASASSAQTPSSQPPTTKPADAGAAKPRVVYNLNPFDMGAARNLGQPKAVEGPTQTADERRAAERREANGDAEGRA